MAIQFNPIDKLILITSGTSISALEIYNAAMNWADEQGNMAYTIPMKAIGKFPMGGGINSDSIFILINGWKIKLYDGNYQFTFTGTLITDDESPRTVSPDSGNVEVVFQTSSQGVIVTQGSGITGEDKQDIADLINPNVEGVSGQVSQVQGQVGDVQEQVDGMQEQVDDIQLQAEDIEHVSEGRWEIVTEDGVDYLIQYRRYDPDIIHMKYKLVKKNGIYVERIPVFQR